MENERRTFVSILTKRRDETYIDSAGTSMVASRSEEFTQTLYYKPFKMKPLYSFSNFQETLQQTCIIQCSLSILICKSQRSLDFRREFIKLFVFPRVA